MFFATKARALFAAMTKREAARPAPRNRGERGDGIIWFQRGLESWEDAKRNAAGFSSPDINIIEKVRRSAKAVAEGRAVYAQDGVLFDEIQYSWPLLASLMFVAARCRSLRIIDFGGSLGTSYRQNARFLDRLRVPIEWRIVERAALVEIGRAEFPRLGFYETIADAAAAAPSVDAILFGGVIQYLDDPYEVLDWAIGTGAEFLIFDRTRITFGPRDTYAVQHFPPSICQAFPIRAMNHCGFQSLLGEKFRPVECWKCEHQPDPETSLMGFLFERK
jgi:putative methyltransferase (TIGR04325 family)